MITREARAYRYYDQGVQKIHTTSVPLNDEEAIKYAALVEQWFTNTSVRFIERSELNEGKYTFMRLEMVNGRAVDLDGSSEKES